MYYVYIVKCFDGTLYTGYTTDIDRRIKEHNGELKGGAKYTSARGPVALVYSELHQTVSEALKREHKIKSYTREEKNTLIESVQL